MTVVYLASPIDAVTDEQRPGLEAMRQAARELLVAEDVCVFDPSRAWTASRDHVDRRVIETDNAALDLADGMLVLWPRHISSVGLPAEIERWSVGRGTRTLYTSETLDGVSDAIVALLKAIWYPDPAWGVTWDVKPKRGIDVVPDHDTVTGWQERIKAYQKAKGWDDQRTVGDDIALIHSELSEALEEHRIGHKPTEVYHKVIGNTSKPEGVPIELADAVIRILGMAARHGIDLEAAIALKMEYNDGRPFRHGGRML